jgi:hypothetical protein
MRDQIAKSGPFFLFQANKRLAPAPAVRAKIGSPDNRQRPNLIPAQAGIHAEAPKPLPEAGMITRRSAAKATRPGMPIPLLREDFAI